MLRFQNGVQYVEILFPPKCWSEVDTCKRVLPFLGKLRSSPIPVPAQFDHIFAFRTAVLALKKITAPRSMQTPQNRSMQNRAEKMPFLGGKQVDNVDKSGLAFVDHCEPLSKMDWSSTTSLGVERGPK